MQHQPTQPLLSCGLWFSKHFVRTVLSCLVMFIGASSVIADDPCCPKTIVAPDRFPTLVNPNCSHCVDEAKRRGDELKPSDNVLCWIRGYSEGGAIPYRFFLNPYPVISDSYGSFVADPYAGFARAYGPWYHYRFHGWHGGVMLIKDTKDDTIYSALSGVALDGPKKGTRLKPIPSVVSTWGDWLQQYPGAVAYHLYPKYQPLDSPPLDEPKAKESCGKADERLPEQTRVLGVNGGKSARAYLESDIASKKLLSDTIDGTSLVILWQDNTKTAAAYRPLASAPRKYKAPAPNKDGISPPLPTPTGLPNDLAVSLYYQPDVKFPAAPYVDAETKSRWDVAGRAVHGELKGWTLEWLDSVQVKWFAWAMEYPTTSIHGQSIKAEEAPAKKLNEQVKAIAGTAEFLKSVPKKTARFQRYQPKNHSITLVMEGETETEWILTKDAEVKRHGWWARPEQFTQGEALWVWFKTNRDGKPIAVSMLMDELTRRDMQTVAQTDKTSDQEALETLRTTQKQWLRDQWISMGLPGTVTFTHIFNGELDVVLDHETMRWARSLKPGTSIQLYSDNQARINGIVKFVQPQRERTLARLVVNGKDQSELNIGDRVQVKIPTPPISVDESPYPSDINQKRSREERIEWFLASIYCTCGVDKDTCTGHVYTLSCCNPNGCGMPNDMRKQLARMIDGGQGDRAIFETLLKKYGSLLVKPHLKP